MPPTDPAPAAQPEAMSTTDAAILAEVKDFLRSKMVATQQKVERLRTVAEAGTVEAYKCFACGNIPGTPALCRSCVAQSKVNPNPRVTNAIQARPPSVPMAAWRAAVRVIIERRPAHSSPSAIMQALDVHLPAARQMLEAAFKAIEQSAAE